MQAGSSCRGFARVAAGAITAIVAMAAGVSSAAAAPSGLADEGGFYTAASPEALGYSQAQNYWTADRIAAAEPLDQPEGTPPAAVGNPELELFSDAPLALKSVEINKPTSYPNRVHGKLVGEFPGLGSYSCSATVVSSGSGSLLTTAGHCAYDVQSRTVATNLAFAPGYSANSIPYGVFPVTNLILNKPWVKRGSLDYDFAMLRMVSGLGTVQGLVGSRGIGFNQPRKQRLEAYGYPSKGNARYNGDRLIRCDGGYVGDPQRYGGPRGRGMRCDQQQGSSGGGWVADHSYVVSNTSHGYPTFSNSLFFGPFYGAEAKSMYKANTNFWPSVGPIRCGGQVVSVVGTDTGERITGTKGKDVIATLGGNDRVNGGGGKDVICGGVGNDKINGGGGADDITGGDGRDKCGKRKGGNKLSQCEGGGGGKKGGGGGKKG